jgi:uncharacterized membrane protein (UPF0127 family)
MKLLKDAFFLLVGLFVLIGSFYLFLQQPAPAKYQVQSVSTLKINEHIINIEIAESDEARARGLSGRTTLESGHGLLFVFPTPGMYGFWMKDMNFPIDIIWISDDWRILGIEKSVSPESYPTAFYPKSPITYALELPAGEAEKLGIDTDSIVYLDR